MDFAEKLHTRYGLPHEAVQELMQEAETVAFGRKETVVEEARRDDYAWFVVSGSVRAYVQREAKYVILFFALEGDAATWFLGDTGSVTSRYTVETLEPSTLLRIPRSRMEELFSRSAVLANWGRRMTEQMLRTTEEYFTDYAWLGKGAQYLRMLRRYPELLQRVPLKDLAAYLFITPQTLSRLRAQLKQKLP